MSRLPVARRSRRSLVALPMLLVLGAVASPAAAAGPTLTLDPGSPLPAGIQTVTVSGSGFDPNAAGGAGIYLAYGPVTAAPRFYMDPSVYSAFKWISVGGPDSPATAPMAADGTFQTEFQVTSTFTSGAGTVDCTVTPCALLAFAAHGSPDRSQDACTVISFQTGAVASGAPTGSAAPGTSPMVAPVASQVPVASGGASPQAGSSSVADPCAAIVSVP